MENINKTTIALVLLGLVILVGLFVVFDKSGKETKSEVTLEPDKEEIKPDPSTIFYDSNGNLIDTIIPTKNQACLDNYVEIAAECEAYKNNDPTPCENYLDNNTVNWCKAKVTEDSSYCELMDPQSEFYAVCFIDTAKSIEDCDAIQFVDNGNGHTEGAAELNECYAAATGDTSYCEALPSGEYNICMGHTLKDSSYCDNSKSFIEKWYCKMEIQYDEPGFCEEYHQEFCSEFYPPEN